ncbi:MAG: type II toxin-antitoxin system RelE/ParE family toxin [Hyphomonadaceae bacterium]
MKTLVWTSAARADLVGIAEYHAQTDTVSATCWSAASSKPVRLTRHDTGRPGRVDGTREKSVADTNYIIVYEIHDDMLFIFRIVHTARDWP